MFPHLVDERKRQPVCDQRAPQQAGDDRLRDRAARKTAPPQAGHARPRGRNLAASGPLHRYRRHSQQETRQAHQPVPVWGTGTDDLGRHTTVGNRFSFHAGNRFLHAESGRTRRGSAQGGCVTGAVEPCISASEGEGDQDRRATTRALAVDFEHCGGLTTRRRSPKYMSYNEHKV